MVLCEETNEALLARYKRVYDDVVARRRRVERMSAGGARTQACMVAGQMYFTLLQIQSLMAERGIERPYAAI